jgi:hypothetical protein
VKVAFIADGVDVNNPDFIRKDGSHVLIDYQDFSSDGVNAPTAGAEAFGDASSIAAQGNQTYDLSGYVNPSHPLPAGCNIRIIGMAPGASLVGLKAFSTGFTTTSGLVQAIDSGRSRRGGGRFPSSGGIQQGAKVDPDGVGRHGLHCLASRAHPRWRFNRQLAAFSIMTTRVIEASGAVESEFTRE